MKSIIVRIDNLAEEILVTATLQKVNVYFDTVVHEEDIDDIIHQNDTLTDENNYLTDRVQELEYDIEKLKDENESLIQKLDLC